MNYWILKTEPSAYSYEDLERDGQTRWDGVRNYQARNNLSQMRFGDHCLIYHSMGPKEIVGAAVIAATAYPDPKDNNWVVVDIKAAKRLGKPVTLSDLKAHPKLKHISLVKQTRLSVCPITKEDWDLIWSLGK